MNKMKEGLIKDTLEPVIKEMQTIITISYVLAVAIGMLFTFQKYSEFEINIFDYADVFDFLIAPFSDYIISLFILVSLSIAFFVFKLDSFWRTEYPTSYTKLNFGLDKKSWYNLYRYFIFGIIFIFYLYLSADIYGFISKKQILAQSTIEIRFADNEIKKGKMIGKTKDVIFLLTDKRVDAIPITSLVKEIEIKIKK